MQNSDKNIKHIIRVATTDLVGSKGIYTALRKIKGISFNFSNAICNVLKLDKNKKAGTLTPEEVKQIEDVIHNPQKYKIPSWLLNRRKDYTTNEDKHLVVSNLKLQKEFESMTSIRSFVSKEDIASMAVYLLSNNSINISGQAIAVDGHTERMV